MRIVVTGNEESVAQGLRELLLRDKRSNEIFLIPSEEVLDCLIGRRPDVVFLIEPEKPEDVASLIQEIRDILPTRVVVVGPEVEAKIVLKLVRDGAYHYLNQHEAESEIGELMSRLHEEPPVVAKFGRIISLLSAGGGTGATTLAVNIGTTLAVQDKRCVLLDLQTEGGDAATLLDLQPTNSIVDFCRHLSRMDSSMFERCLARHAKGLHLLAAPRDYSEIAKVSVAGVRKAVNMARRAFDVALIDLKSVHQPHEVQGLMQTDVVLLVLRLDFTSIRNARRLLDALKDLEIDGDRVHVIANRFRRPGELRVRDAEKALGRSILQYVPEDGRRVNAANNGGVPVVLQYPRCRVSKCIQLIAASVGESVSSQCEAVSNTHH